MSNSSSGFFILGGDAALVADQDRSNFLAASLLAASASDAA
jgi:hypothetical protein